ncbi:SDR family NAD(P)-dependent oxidoreductase [Janthinobacterium sp. PC23-8]|uniref:SDR family NAD(P)-dependent oxidoreductase n=1 Tax=Janthinobacterium sp. PC23-8 TaxID=2012679 RepID=UPI000B9617FE|nr:SDR family oxidoreductase [Janthinobacterium sp. PC23-8]OYO31292.1 short-chain dehydrogenase [Janthinobacterium sp. PC23-8]
MTTEQTIALVTGASRGLGRNAALHLARQGVDVIITYHAQRAEAEAVAAEITQLGRRAAVLQLDSAQVASFAPFAAQVRTVLAGWGREQFDYLVNNAGIGLMAPFAETSEAMFDQLMNIHFKGVFFLTQTLLPLIADGGRILNISSGLTRFSMPGMSAYAAMKGAVEVLSRYLAKELGARGIAVNTLAPGAIATDFGGGDVRDNPHIQQYLAAQTALGRVGEPDDIGPMIAALLSDSHRWVNGQRVEVSGGIYL